MMNAPSPIPTGLCPPAQGCAPCATLGHAPQHFPQPQRGCVLPVRADGIIVGVDDISPGSPRVASRTRQPWAGGRYPVGVINQKSLAATIKSCLIVQTEGTRQVSREVLNYSLRSATIRKSRKVRLARPTCKDYLQVHPPCPLWSPCHD